MYDGKIKCYKKYFLGPTQMQGLSLTKYVSTFVVLSPSEKEVVKLSCNCQGLLEE